MGVDLWVALALDDIFVIAEFDILLAIVSFGRSLRVAGRSVKRCPVLRAIVEYSRARYNYSGHSSLVCSFYVV